MNKVRGRLGWFLNLLWILWVGLLGACSHSTTDEPVSFDWTQYQTLLAQVYPLTQPQVPYGGLQKVRTLLEPVTQILPTLETQEQVIEFAEAFMAENGEILWSEGGQAISQALLDLEIRETFLDAYLLAVAHLTADHLERIVPPVLLTELGPSFAEIKVVTEKAARAVREFGAKAHALGDRVDFQPVPSAAGMAHEAAHVVQEKRPTLESAQPKSSGMHRVDEILEKRAKLKDARKKLKDAWDKYSKLYDAMKKGKKDDLGRAKPDLLDVIQAAAAVEEALDEANECLKALGEKTLELEDLEEEEF